MAAAAAAHNDAAPVVFWYQQFLTNWCCCPRPTNIMAPKKKFDPTGDFACQIVRYLIHKAKEARDQGVNASEGDYTWKTFAKECESLARSISDNHPGGQGDNCRLARINFNRQATKFVDWLANGRGKQEQEHAAD
jgi:hypothetical protein